MDKIKWIRLIQWKFGGRGIYESFPVCSKIDEGYVRSSGWKSKAPLIGTIRCELINVCGVLGPKHPASFRK